MLKREELAQNKQEEIKMSLINIVSVVIKDNEANPIADPSEWMEVQRLFEKKKIESRAKVKMRRG